MIPNYLNLPNDMRHMLTRSTNNTSATGSFLGTSYIFFNHFRFANGALPIQWFDIRIPQSNRLPTGHRPFSGVTSEYNGRADFQRDTSHLTAWHTLLHFIEKKRKYYKLCLILYYPCTWPQFGGGKQQIHNIYTRRNTFINRTYNFNFNKRTLTLN